MKPDLHAIETEPIEIESCPYCEPEKWETEGQSEHFYKCGKCERIVQLVLRRKG